jgi:hypothetical protein
VEASEEDERRLHTREEARRAKEAEDARQLLESRKKANQYLRRGLTASLVFSVIAFGAAGYAYWSGPAPSSV